MKLVLYPDPFLTSPANLLPGMPDSFIVEKMLYLMRKHKGIGLSANQVGIDARFFVLDAASLGIEDVLFINPELVKAFYTTSVEEEGCLSYPGHRVAMTRSVKIALSFSDHRNQTVIKEYEGLAARAIQHELDHLQGIGIWQYEVVKPPMTSFPELAAK